MTRSLRTLIRCLVCGSAEVRTDEVVERGLVLLGECRRCDHRWTQPLAGPSGGREAPARLAPSRARVAAGVHAA